MLDVRLEWQGDDLTVKLEGTVDYSTVDRLDIEFPSPFKRLIFDCEALDFIDSSGIGKILSIIHELGERRVSVSFANLKAEIHDMFDMIGVYRIVASIGHGEG